jgi:hypothetical protein
VDLQKIPLAIDQKTDHASPNFPKKIKNIYSKLAGSWHALTFAHQIETVISTTKKANAVTTTTFCPHKPILCESVCPILNSMAF